ncbi:hypothetical protein LV779_03005 [Streptomyces thinghirensis]|nr:hypothetical protein [Streptomyces thinghirensis]
MHNSHPLGRDRVQVATYRRKMRPRVMAKIGVGLRHRRGAAGQPASDLRAAGCGGSPPSSPDRSSAPPPARGGGMNEPNPFLDPARQSELCGPRLSAGRGAPAP